MVKKSSFNEFTRGDSTWYAVMVMSYIVGRTGGALPELNLKTKTQETVSPGDKEFGITNIVGAVSTHVPITHTDAGS